MNDMKPIPGTYALILHCSSGAEIEIGRWGRLIVQPAFYIYIGSAFGPGGIQARVTRHLRTTKSKYWHIDYLLEYVKPVSVWYSYKPVKLEHEWARIFCEMKNIHPVKGFGCSDCSCIAHLFTTTVKPDFKNFSDAIGCNIQLYQYQNPNGRPVNLIIQQ